LTATRWQTTWGAAADAVLPILHFTRRHRLRTLAMNVSPELVAKVGRAGWRGVPANEREGVGDAARPDAAYLQRLQRTYAEHGCRPPESVAGTPGFARFVDAQLLWDRGMAEALATALAADDEALVVGLAGSGHLEHGSGIPRQLAALGIENVLVLLPWDVSRGCTDLTADVADLVFGVDPLAAERPAPTRHACEKLGQPPR
jgi:uncharacterized iron-regulated protein